MEHNTHRSDSDAAPVGGGKRYRVYLTPDLPTEQIEHVGDYRTAADARKAAKREVAGSRGASPCGTPACADNDAWEAWTDRDGDDESPIAWIEVSN